MKIEKLARNHSVLQLYVVTRNKSLDPQIIPWYNLQVKRKTHIDVDFTLLLVFEFLILILFNFFFFLICHFTFLAVLSSVVDLFVQAILETMLSSIDTETEGGGGCCRRG